MIKNEYIVRAGKLVTVSKELGTLYDGAFAVQDGKILEIGNYPLLKEKYHNLILLITANM